MIASFLEDLTQYIPIIYTRQEDSSNENQLIVDLKTFMQAPVEYLDSISTIFFQIILLEDNLGKIDNSGIYTDLLNFLGVLVGLRRPILVVEEGFVLDVSNLDRAEFGNPNQNTESPMTDLEYFRALKARFKKFFNNSIDSFVSSIADLMTVENSDISLSITDPNSIVVTINDDNPQSNRNRKSAILSYKDELGYELWPNPMYEIVTFNFIG